MSYWITLLEHDDEPCAVSRHQEGGNYVLGGTDAATINVTYNYERFFPFRSLHERSGSATIDDLQAAVDRLGTHQDDNYWAPTPGNAGHTLSILLRWARLHPDGVWRVN